MNSKYRKMLRIMKEREEASSDLSSENWFLYILKCNDGTFYTGITKNLDRRFKMHQDGKASRYTRTRRPVEMIYREICGSRTQALVRECAVKALPKQKKLALINS